MNDHFICPKCNGHLQVGGYVILIVTTKKNKRGFVLLSPELGDYTKVIHPDLQIEKGAEMNFTCPLCQSNLAAYDVSTKLVHLIMVDSNGEKHDVYFSGVEGEHCTYKISEKKYEKFGSAADLYDSYFMTRRV